MHPTLAIAAKDLRLLWRDRAAMFFTIVFPVVFASVFGMIYSGMGGEASAVRVAVVDRSGSPASRAVIARVDGQDAIDADVVADEATGRELVRSGQRSACLVIPPDFANLPSRLLSGEPVTLELAIDPSRVQERAMIEGLVAQAAFEQLTAGFQDAASLRAFTTDARAALDTNPDLGFMQRAAAMTLLGDIERLADQMEGDEAPIAAADAPDGAPDDPADNVSDNVSDDVSGGPPDAFTPIEIHITQVAGHAPEWHASAFSVTFAQGVVWALIGCAASFSMSLVIERAAGTLLRLRAAPMSAWHVVAGKGLACAATTLVAAALLIAVGALAFGLRVQQPAMLAAALLAAAAAFVGIMMVLAGLARTPRAAGPLGYAILLTMAIVGGGMMPHFMMPRWMQSIGMLSPVKWTVVAVENAVFRGASWGEQAAPLAVLVGIGVVGVAIGGAVFARARE